MWAVLRGRLGLRPPAGSRSKRRLVAQPAIRAGRSHRLVALCGDAREATAHTHTHTHTAAAWHVFTWLRSLSMIHARHKNARVCVCLCVCVCVCLTLRQGLPNTMSKPCNGSCVSRGMGIPGLGTNRGWEPPKKEDHRLLCTHTHTHTHVHTL